MNKILRTLYIAPLAFLLTGCWTRIWTVAPTETYETPVQTVYSTQVTYPSPRTTTTNTVTVTSYNNDWSFYLDLQAVAAAFAESNTVQEFERLLNSNRYMINNLDLNHDGWIDYLRVIESRQGYYHTFLIQACLGPRTFQDVATLVAERRSDRLYVEVIGDRYLYGYNYVVRPVFVKRPPLWDYFGRPTYTAWVSPYYHGYWPNYYQQYKPVYLNHYQAYVSTYMHNHHYCHHCDYPQQPYWNGYTQVTKPNERHDYQELHPTQSFEHRVGNISSASGAAVRNAGQLRTEVAREEGRSQSVETTRPTATTTSSRQTQQTTTRSQEQSATRQSSQQTTSTQQTSTRTSGTAQQSTRTPSTSVSTRVNKSGETRTTIKTTDAKGRTQTVQRTSSSSSQRTGTSSSDSSKSTRTTEPQRTSTSSRR